MAEVVHRNLESMLPQLEELESSGIFTHDEIKQIVRRRRNHEYKLLRRPARKEDFLAAVQYEMHLEQLRQHRKKRLGVPTTKYDAENGILNRIHSLFNRALKKFKGDLKLWLQHIEFSKQCGHKVSLSRTFGRALAIHPNNPGLWVMAAKFEFEDMKDMSSARSLLQQGLRTNPQSKHLWIEYFRMELLHTDKVKKRRAVLGVDMAESEEPSSDQFLSNKAASLVYQQAVTNIQLDVEFRLSFLPVVLLFHDTNSLQDQVYKDVEGTFPTHPLVWQALARRQWEGLDNPLTDAQTEKMERQTEELFQEGIARAGDDQSLVMQHWDGYLHWCRERVDNAPSSLRKKAVRRMLTAFKQASLNGHLSEAKYKEYIDTMLTLGLSREAASISELGTGAYPSSLPLWIARLSSCSEKVGQLCRQALDQVDKQHTLPIWEFWVNHALENEIKEKEIESLFKGGVASGVAAVYEAMSVRYLEWSYSVGGVKKTRNAYKSLLSERQPVPHCLYERCIHLERRGLLERSDGQSLKHLRELYQRALADYGSSHPGLWLGYIEMELRFPGGLVENVGQLHWKAIKELKPELTSDFISRYSLMHSESAVVT
ncbi:U3 small nucleolar RNA-associated protein 6 homolog [Halichondria panicea]|uniref:U3 small nucleolar RNA-associated protein 6 homolog n=1 Tax=Halichondria panicea TaxID=6063 RepID=UPI00312BA4FD